MNNLMQYSLENICRGYQFNELENAYSCLQCGKMFPTDEVFHCEEKFFTAKKAVVAHCKKEHNEIFSVLMAMDKKSIGLTDNHKELLRLFHLGFSDREISKEMGVAESTVRQQRFVFKEKAKQAKAYLAIYELAFAKVKR